MILKIALVSAVCNIILTPLSSLLASLFGYITVISFALYPFLRRGGLQAVPLKVLLLIGLVIVSILSSLSYIKDTSIKQILISSASFIAFYWVILSRDDNEKITFDFIFKISVILSLVFAVYTFGNFSFKYTEYDQYGARMFTMGLGNPNGVSAYVFFVIIVFIMKCYITKSPRRRFVIIILIAIQLHTLTLLSSRTVIFCLLLVVLYALFLKNRNIPRFAVYAALAFPIFMICVTYIISSKFPDLHVMGKALDTGRFSMYMAFFKNVESAPAQYLFGNYCKYPMANLHNGTLSIFAAIGLVGLLFYIDIWLNLLKKTLNTSQNLFQKIAVVTTMTFIVQSSSEALNVTGAIPYSLFVLVIVKIAKGEILIDTKL